MLLFVAIGLASCKGDGDIVPAFKTTALNVVNADNNVLNIYQNGTRIYNLSSINPGGVTGYIAVQYGTQQYQLKKAGPDAPEYLLDDFPLTLDTLNSYSLFIAGETPDKLFLTTDVGLVSAPKQAVIRFVNTLPGSVNLDVSIGALTYNNVAFKSPGAFKYINAGANAIKVYQTGSTKPLITDTFTLLEGTTYTVFIIGTINGTGANKLTAKLSTN